MHNEFSDYIADRRIKFVWKKLYNININDNNNNKNVINLFLL